MLITLRPLHFVMPHGRLWFLSFGRSLVIPQAFTHGRESRHILDLKGMAISAGAACDSMNMQISHVLKAIHLPRKFAEGMVRISFGVENTSEEVDVLLNALRIAVR